MIESIALKILSFLSLALFGFLAVLAIYFCVLYIIDRTQKQHTIRRNYPLIGRARYYFEHLGTFFRQYFYAMDREELPFNRAVRSWVYRAAKNVDTSIAFGSTHDPRRVGSPCFRHAAYPVLASDAIAPSIKVIGPNCASPYQPHSYFNISAMSYGALSAVAIQALSRGAAQAGCWLNSGEGGLSPHHLEGECDIVFQIGTAKYGVRDSDGKFCPERLREICARPQVKMIELKLSQGAKPGKGGLLPGAKITDEIARIRGIEANQDSISPNRHTEFSDDQGLLDFVAELKRISGLPVGIKFALGDEQWPQSLCQAIAQRQLDERPDFLNVDGAEGGTGAAPQPLMDFVGLPLWDALTIVNKALVANNLKKDIRLIAAGKLVSPSAVATALALGADYAVSARGFMFALGCIQAMQCNRNTCPTGITTHDSKLQRGLIPQSKSTRVAQYHYNMVKHVEQVAHACGVGSSTSLSESNVKIIGNPR
jgi:glutamate synthase domain-containing protein 2